MLFHVLGYEVQKGSVGYMIDRAKGCALSPTGPCVLGAATSASAERTPGPGGHRPQRLPFIQAISRMPEERASKLNEHDAYGAEEDSGIHVTGVSTLQYYYATCRKLCSDVYSVMCCVVMCIDQKCHHLVY